MARWSSMLLAFVVPTLMAAHATAQPLTMDSLWPSADGLSWRYAQHYEEHDPDSMTVDNQVRIYFDGMVVAPDGIDCQYLHEDALGGPAPAMTAAALPRDPFLRQLWIARPELRHEIQRVVQEASCPGTHPAGAYALLLGGEFAFRKTSSEIAAWRCNLADTRSWLWLVSDLTIGNTFDLQLIPDLASNVMLHGTIAAVEPIDMPGGSFPTSLRVDYVIDYGTSTCTDDAGSEEGTIRYETRGHVHYVPNIGPVESSEQFLVAELTGTCGTRTHVGPIASTSMQLLSLPTPTRRKTWGELKTLYR